MAKMKAVQVPRAGADFEIVEREIPNPGPGQVRIRVQACGICHSDVVTKEGLFPGIAYPRVPGHEVAGVIDEVGAGVEAWKRGERVGVGWHGGQDDAEFGFPAHHARVSLGGLCERVLFDHWAHSASTGATMYS